MASCSTEPPDHKLNILSLPRDVLETIFACLSYQEITEIRLVCATFCDVADYLLKVGLVKLKTSIERRMRDLKRQSEKRRVLFHDRVKLFSCHCLLECLKSETDIIEAVCWKSIANGKCSFPAGRILDEFHNILRTIKRGGIQDWTIEDDVTDNLYTLNKTFVDNFECHVLERETNSLFGSRIMDILECSLNSTCRVELLHDQYSCRLAACYEFRGCCLVRTPPKIMNPGEMATEPDRRALCRYLRYLIRTNNKYLLMDKVRFCNIAAVSGVRPCLSPLCLSRREEQAQFDDTVEELWEKELKNSDLRRFIDMDRVNLKCDLLLECPNSYAPLSLNHLPGNSTRIFQQKKNNPNGFFSSKESSRDRQYGFVLDLKVTYPTYLQGDFPSEEYYTICHGKVLRSKGRLLHPFDDVELYNVDLDV